MWYGGATLDGGLGLGTMRRRWRAGRAGAPRAAADFTGAEAADIFGHAAATAAGAARRLRAGPGPDGAADIAWAAADVLYTAADATGNDELRRAADGFSRAARAPWGRIPPPSPTGSGLRTAAYLLAACVPAGSRRTMTRLALIRALAGLARAVAELRQTQLRLLQATAAHRAAVDLATVGDAAGKVPVVLATIDTTGPPVTTRRAGARLRVACLDRARYPDRGGLGDTAASGTGKRVSPLTRGPFGGRPGLGRPARRRDGRPEAGCVTSVLILVREGATCAMTDPSLPAFSQVGGLETRKD